MRATWASQRRLEAARERRPEKKNLVLIPCQNFRRRDFRILLMWTMPQIYGHHNYMIRKHLILLQLFFIVWVGLLITYQNMTPNMVTIRLLIGNYIIKGFNNIKRTYNFIIAAINLMISWWYISFYYKLYLIEQAYFWWAVSK